MKSSTMAAWPVKSVSICGAAQSISTPACFDAATAPARTVCQKTWTWPLGTTAIVMRPGVDDRLQPVRAAAARRVRVIVRPRVVIEPP
jgi:hypothetical protein